MSQAKKDRFAAVIQKALCQSGFGNPRYEQASFCFQLGTDSDPHQLNLHNLYREYRALWPWQRSEVVRRAVATANEAAAKKPERWEDIRESILPAVRHRFFLEAARLQMLAAGQEPEPFAYRPLAEHLVVVPAHDQETTIGLLSERKLTEWGVTLDEALAVGQKNLTARTQPAWKRVGDGLFMSEWQDDYDSSRILVEHVFSELDLTGEPVVVIPQRGLILVAGSEDPQALQLELALLEKRFAAGDTPDSAIPIVRAWPSWKPLVLPEGHPAYQVWIRVQILEMATLYAHQAKLLETLHQKTGEDVFVASVMEAESKEASEPYTVAVWSKAVETLLPKTDMVALVDPELPEGESTLGPFTWGLVQKHCRDLMQETEHYPPRYLAEEFPTAEQVAALEASATAGGSS